MKISDTISFGNVKTGYMYESSRPCTSVFSACSAARTRSRSKTWFNISVRRVRSASMVLSIAGNILESENLRLRDRSGIGRGLGDFRSAMNLA
jgi:hypothetical protein